MTDPRDKRDGDPPGPGRRGVLRGVGLRRGGVLWGRLRGLAAVPARQLRPAAGGRRCTGTSPAGRSSASRRNGSAFHLGKLPPSSRWALAHSVPFLILTDVCAAGPARIRPLATATLGPGRHRESCAIASTTSTEPSAPPSAMRAHRLAVGGRLRQQYPDPWPGLRWNRCRAAELGKKAGPHLVRGAPRRIAAASAGGGSALQPPQSTSSQDRRGLQRPLRTRSTWTPCRPSAGGGPPDDAANNGGPLAPTPRHQPDHLVRTRKLSQADAA